MHIEHLLDAVGGVSMQVRLECADCFPVEVVVLADEQLEILLHLLQLALLKFVLVELHFGMQQMLQVSPFFLDQKQECFPLRVVASAGTAHSMNVLFDIEWGVVLHDPVDLGNVESPCGHVCAQEDSFLELAKLVEGG